jgi:hypothetical protein
VEAFHFTDGIVDFAECHLTGEERIEFGEQEAALGRCVFAGKIGKFPIEILEAQAESRAIAHIRGTARGLGRCAGSTLPGKSSTLSPSKEAEHAEK